MENSFDFRSLTLGWQWALSLHPRLASQWNFGFKYSDLGTGLQREAAMGGAALNFARSKLTTTLRASQILSFHQKQLRRESRTKFTSTSTKPTTPTGQSINRSAANPPCTVGSCSLPLCSINQLQRASLENCLSFLRCLLSPPAEAQASARITCSARGLWQSAVPPYGRLN